MYNMAVCQSIDIIDIIRYIHQSDMQILQAMNIYEKRNLIELTVTWKFTCFKTKTIAKYRESVFLVLLPTHKYIYQE